ncbi:PH domain-containing protein [Nesterenkonia sp. HG001]|uniref:PH domain-containing protein n=1 Tax=Nesterenkonia sp. HG001 TaxID=2983207 RepID=UPI002AC6CA02|nr:PH domain-containing protein [Nesterenkonia sp. HG001]MDZ5078202.1 PH domain-containing protein [Nesterenkonia sp. HG001]
MTQAETGEPGQKWFDETWTKVHPLSPFVRGWLTVIAVPGIIFGYNWEIWADLWHMYRSGELWDQVDRHPLIFLAGGGGMLLLLIVVFGGFVLSWWFTRYKITDEHVMVKSGIFVRQHRQARIDRVQAVDLRQPLLARFTGLAELKFEVAEGDGTAATLAFLKKPQAEQLRADIMDRASGKAQWRQQQAEAAGTPAAGPAHDGAPRLVSPPGVEDTAGPVPGASHRVDPGGAVPGQGPHAPLFQEVPDREVTRVPTGRLVGSVLMGWGTILLAIIAGFGLIGAVVGGIVSLVIGVEDPLGQVGSAVSLIGAGILPSLIPVGLVVITMYYQQFSGGFRFTATMTGAGLKMRYGLLETTTQTVPPGRVQALQIHQPLLWRPFRWFRVLVVVAGYGVGEKRSVLLPVGRIEEVMAVTAEMFPDLKVPHPEQVVTEGLLGSGTEFGFTEVPRRARIFDPIVRRRRGFFITPSALMFRDGRLSRRLTLMAHERIQSLALQQGPWQRAKRLADIQLHTPAGPFQMQLSNQDLDAAQWLFEHESRHAAFARRMSDRNHWMLPEELHEFERMVSQVGSGPGGEPDERRG